MKPTVYFSSSNFVLEGFSIYCIKRLPKFGVNLSKGPGDAKRTGTAEYFARSSLYPYRLLPLDNAVVLLLFIHCCIICVCVWGGGGVWSLFCCVVLNFLSRFVIISLGKRELVAYFQMPSICHVSVMCFFLMVP